ncbi:hypothetical protein KL943_002313 [Ogataea angusta]|nr:hypothetical protein KL943_002313 [Ogataea angusta]
MSDNESNSDVEEVEEVSPPVTNRQMSADEMQRLAEERTKIRAQLRAFSQANQPPPQEAIPQAVDEDGVPLDMKKGMEYLQEPLEEYKEVELAEKLLKKKREEDEGIRGESDGEDFEDLLDMFGIDAEEISINMNLNQRQQLLLENMDAEQINRYEYFRRTNLNTGGIKKLVNMAIGYNVGTDFAKILAGVGKVFVGEVVEKAKEVQKRQNSARVEEQLEYKRKLKRYENELAELDNETKRRKLNKESTDDLPELTDIARPDGPAATFRSYRVKVPDDRDQLTPDHIREAWRLLIEENHTILQPRWRKQGGGDGWLFR